MRAVKNVFLTILSLVLGTGFTFFKAQAAGSTELIRNGNFETGSFGPYWTVVPGGDVAETIRNSATYVINDGTFRPIFYPDYLDALPAISGQFDAVGTQWGILLISLQQTITVPNNIFSAKLSWKDRVRNFDYIRGDGYGFEPRQEWRVVIRDPPSDAAVEPLAQVEQVVFSTKIGDPWLQVGPNARSGDVTATLQARAGRTVVVSFETQAYFYFMPIALDDVSLVVSILRTQVTA